MDQGVDLDDWRRDSEEWVVVNSCVDALIQGEWRRCMVAEVKPTEDTVLVIDADEVREIPKKNIRRSQILELGDQVTAKNLLGKDSMLNGMRGVIATGETPEFSVNVQFSHPYGKKTLHSSKLNPCKGRRESVCLLLPPVIREESDLTSTPYGETERDSGPSLGPTPPIMTFNQPRRIESVASLTVDYKPIATLRSQASRRIKGGASPAPSDMLLRSMCNMTYSSFGGDILPVKEIREQVWTPPFIEKKTRKILRTQKLHRALNKTRTCGHEVEDVMRDKALRRRALLIAAVSISGIVSAIMSLLLTGSIEGRSFSEGTTIGNFTLQVVGSFLSLVSILLITELHYRALQYDKEHVPNVSFLGGEDGWEDMLVRGRLLTLAIEVFIHLLYPFPYFTQTRWGVHLACFMFLRVYTTVRAFTLYTPGYIYRFDILSQPHISGRFTEYSIGWKAALKIFLVRRTFTFFFVVISTSLMCCSFMIYIAEREAQPDSFRNMRDAVYFMFVTFTTIGYGELVPITDLGRAVTVIAGGLGVFLANLFAAIFAVKFQPTPIETEIIRYIEKIDVSKERYLAAVRFIQLYWRDRRRALENGLWHLYAEGDAGIHSWLDVDTARALILSKQARLRQLDMMGDSVADRDLIATRTHTSILKQGKEMKKLWNRLKGLATVLAGIKENVRGLEGGVMKESQAMRSKCNKVYDLCARADRKNSATESHHMSLLTEILDVVQGIKSGNGRDPTTPTRGLNLCAPLPRQNSSAPTIPASPGLQGFRPSSPFRSVSPTPSITLSNRAEGATPPASPDERLSTLQSKILAVSLQQRAQNQAIESLHDRLINIEDMLKTLVAGQGLNNTLTS